MRAALLATALFLAAPAAAMDHAAVARRALDARITPAVAALAQATAALADAAGATCDPVAPGDPVALTAAYHAAFDAWAATDHLRLGPLLEGETAFAVAFWPDPRGATPRALAGLIAAENPVVDDPAAFRAASVAARGLLALEQLLFDPEALPLEPGAYRCRLAVAIARDLVMTAAELRDRWADPWAGLLLSAGAPDHPIWATPEEATRALYAALTEGLQATADLRLGRPLGTLDKPQPRRAEAWRSGRSLRNVEVALAAMRAFAASVFGPEIEPGAAAAVDRAFAAALEAAGDVGMPLPEAVAAPGPRLRVEFLRSETAAARDAVATHIGGGLGLAAGFNAMDGD